MKKFKRIASFVLAAVFMLACTACGGAAPESIAVSFLGETAEEINLIYDAANEAGNTAVLTAVITPEDYSGSLSWSSDDAGVVKVSGQDGRDCTLSLLKAGTAKVTVSAGGASASVKVTVTAGTVSAAQSSSFLTDANATAVIIGGREVSVGKLNIYYVSQYASFMDSYGAYAAYFGLDTSYGIAGLENQATDMSEEGTWRGYFLEQAVMMIQQIQALNDWAAENGIELDEADLESLQTTLDSLETTAVSNSFASAEAFLAACYGEGTTVEMYEEYLKEYTLGFKAYAAYTEALEFSDEELDAYYSTLGYAEGENEYNLTSMRHILIMAEASADGTYSGAALAAARATAETLYENWLASGGDEDSFAELANQYSDDGGSNTNGGYYGEIYMGEMMPDIDDWLFGGRSYGDTALIDINDRYAGTHIVFFTGEGEMYSRVLARSELENQVVSDWFTELCDACPVEYCEAYDDAARF